MELDLAAAPLAGAGPAHWSLIDDLATGEAWLALVGLGGVTLLAATLMAWGGWRLIAPRAGGGHSGWWPPVLAGGWWLVLLVFALLGLWAPSPRTPRLSDPWGIGFLPAPRQGSDSGVREEVAHRALLGISGWVDGRVGPLVRGPVEAGPWLRYGRWSQQVARAQLWGLAFGLGAAGLVGVGLVAWASWGTVRWLRAETESERWMGLWLAGLGLLAVVVVGLGRLDHRELRQRQGPLRWMGEASAWVSYEIVEPLRASARRYEMLQRSRPGGR